MGLLLIFNIDETRLWIPPGEVQLFILGLTFTVTFLLPLLNALLLLKMKQINSLSMETKEERKIPYLIAAIFYLGEYYFLVKADFPGIIQGLMIGATLLVVSVLLINIFWKISAHMVGIGGLCGMILAISYRLQINLPFVLIILFLLAGLMGFARLRLSAHNPAQVYAGFLLGISVQLILFL